MTRRLFDDAARLLKLTKAQTGGLSFHSYKS